MSTVEETQQTTAMVAAAHLPSDLAILRLENETIQSLAAARPRNHAMILEEIKAQLKAYPSFARDAIYNKPVGRGNDTCGACGVELYQKNGRSASKCFKCGSTKIVEGRMRYARGLSVRAAEAIAEAYGYCRIRTDVSPVDDLTVKVEATFTDYQKGRIWQDAGLVSKMFRTRSGQMQRIADDRFYGVVVKAELSKRVREVITRSVPPGLRSELFELAEAQMAKLLDEKTVNAIVEKFSGMGVTLEQLERRLGRTRKAGWTAADRLDLLGLWNALKDGETTMEEAFGDIREHTEKDTAPPTNAATLDDIVGTEGDTESVDSFFDKSPLTN